MAQDTVEIPTTNSRKKYAKRFSIALTIWGLLTALFVIKGWVTDSQVMLIGCTFERWYIGQGACMAIYTGGEIGSKVAYATANRIYR